MAIIVAADTAAADTAARRAEAVVGPVLYRHPSRRPWVLGDIGNRSVASARSRNIEVLAIGHDVPDERDLEAALSRAGSLASLYGAPARRLTGFDGILVGRDETGMKLQTPVFQTRSVFWAQSEKTHLISDEQLPLARLNNLEVDKLVLASRLTDADLSYPFSTLSIWQGVYALGPGEFLDFTLSGTPERRLWWTPPKPDRRLAELAPELRAGIDSAIRDRARLTSEVSSDLSGGLDSTTLSFFVSEQRRGHNHTFFMQSRNPSNNDWKWANRAAREIGSNHITVPYQSIVDGLVDDEAITLHRLPEGPNMSSTAELSTLKIARSVTPAGSGIHLNGHAGDALFGPVSSMLWSLVHSKEPLRVRRALRHCALNRIPITAATKMLFRRSSYQDELAELARGDFHRPRHESESYSRWINTPQFHPALTGTAKAYVADLVARELSSSVQPFSDDRTTNQILQYLLVHGAVTRRMNLTLGNNAAIYFDSPYLDDRVVTPAISLNIGERTFQYPAKPLLASVRPGSMSVEYFLRRDKGEYSSETFDQHRQHLARIRSLFADGSHLEDLGLVSGDALRAALSEYSLDGVSYSNLGYIEFAEQWLRSVTQAKNSPEREL